MKNEYEIRGDTTAIFLTLAAVVVAGQWMGGLLIG